MRTSRRIIDKFKFYDLVIYAARNSNSARRLATSLGSRRWRDDLPERYRRRRPYFRGNSSPLVVNWGSSVHPSWLEDSRFQLRPIILNHGDNIKAAVDKLVFFQRASGIDGVPLLKWTAERSGAEAWLDKGKSVIARTEIRGSSGKGIVLVKPGESLIEAPLYTRYYPKTHEFRVHVFDSKVIDLTEKKFRGGKDARLANSGERTVVRSHFNGWIHAHDGLSLSIDSEIQSISRSCVACVNGLGLDFAAVDVLAILEPPDADKRRRLKNFVICEVNTGPGLENTKTIEAYKNAIIEKKKLQSVLVP